MHGPPQPAMPPCPKCRAVAAVIYLGESRAFQAKGKPPIAVYGCRTCNEEFAPRTPDDHPKIIEVPATLGTLRTR